MGLQTSIYDIELVQYIELAGFEMSGRGAERTLDAFEWFSATVAPVTFTDFTKALDLPKSSALLLLRMLVERGYLDRLSDGRYTLLRLPGERLSGQEKWGTLLRLADQPLRVAVEEVEETGFVAVMDGGRVRYLNKILPTREIRYDRNITATRHPHQVASGIVMLSGLPAESLARYLSDAGLSEQERSDVGRNVAQAGLDGFYANLNGVVEGASGIAAPVVDTAGDIIAAINISGPQERFLGNLDRIKSTVLAVAQTVSARLQQRRPN